MATPPLKRRRKDEGELEKPLATHRDRLHARMQQYLAQLPQLVQRFQKLADNTARRRPPLPRAGGPAAPGSASATPTTTAATTPASLPSKSPRSPRKRKGSVGKSPGKRAALSPATPLPDAPKAPKAAAAAAAAPESPRKAFPSTPPDVALERPARAATPRKAKAPQTEKEKKEAAEKAADQKEMEALPLPPDNSLLLDHISMLKSESHMVQRELISITEWIMLMMPTLQDTDSLGAEIQLAIHSELMNLAKEVETKYDMEFTYLESRASLESKYYKFYRVPLWRRCIEQLDTDKWNEVEAGWLELIRMTLYSSQCLFNNMEKLKNPKPPPKLLMSM